MIFSAQKSMSFLTESEAASMGFRKEGSLIAKSAVCRARLRCFIRSRVSLARLFSGCFFGGVCTNLSMDAKNRNASFSDLMVGRMTSCASSYFINYFALEVCIYDSLTKSSILSRGWLPNWVIFPSQSG